MQLDPARPSAMYALVARGGRTFKPHAHMQVIAFHCCMRIKIRIYATKIWKETAVTPTTAGLNPLGLQAMSRYGME